MDLWRELEPGRKVPYIITVVTVTPKDSVNVYRYAHELDACVLEHVIHTPFRPPGDLGFVPRTYTEGNAPLDALVLSASPNVQRTLVDCRPVGLLRMSVGGVRDDRVLCVPHLDPRANDTLDVRDVNPHTLEEVVHFFESLFRSQGRTIRTDQWLGVDEACRAVDRAIGLYKRRFTVVEV